MKLKRVSISFDDDVVKLVEDWRKQQDKIPNFNTAVNTMLMRYGALLKLNEMQEHFFKANHTEAKE